ncbi:hypothetical protein BH11MYX3_BH11MYX3_17150 [soil metagenome]
MPLRLRAELELQAADDRGGKLLDPLFERTVTLGPTGVALARALDGTRDLDPLIHELLAAGFVRGTIEDTLRCLTLLHLIEGIGDPVRDRVRAIWAGEVVLEHRALPGVRFECQGSGMCCRSYRLGPLTAEEVASLSALPLRETFPDLPDGELFVQLDAKLYLRSIESRCVFLQADRRCGIHASFGADAKPGVCQTYPITSKRTFQAALVYNNQQCASHFVSQDRGPPLIESAHLLRQRLTGRITLFHPIVFVREDTPVDYAHFLELEAALRHVVGEGSPFSQLAHALDVYDSFVAAARSFPLGSDPAPVLAGWRASIATQPTSAQRACVDADRDATLATLDSLSEQLASFLANLDRADAGDRDMVPLVNELMPLLDALRVRARRRSSITAVLSNEVASALRTSLAQRFQGDLSLPEDRPLSALGQAALAIALGFAGSPRDGSARAADLSRGHTLANRVLPPFTTPMFREHPDRVRALIATLESLCAG